MFRIRSSWLLAALCVTAGPVRAQPDGGLAGLARNPASTRAMALGNSFLFERQNGFGRGRDVDALFYHPAGLRGATGASIGVHRIGPDERAASLAVARDLWKGSFALGVRVLSHHGEAFVASAAYARRVLGIDAGLVAKLVDESGSGADASGGAIDLGVGRSVGPLYVAVSGRNLGPDPGTFELPWTVGLGAATGNETLGPLDVAGTFSLAYGEEREWMPGGGVEVSWWPVMGRTFTGRIGLQRVPYGTRSALSFGLAFTGDSISFEYAYRPDRDTDGGHRFGVSWR